MLQTTRSLGLLGLPLPVEASYLEFGECVHVGHEVQHLTYVLSHALHRRRPALKHKDSAGGALRVTAFTVALTAVTVLF